MDKKWWIILGIVIAAVLILIFLCSQKTILGSPIAIYNGTAQIYPIAPYVSNLTQVTLNDLDGSGLLRGKYVNVYVINAKTPCGKGKPTQRVFEKDLNFTYAPVPVILIKNFTKNGTLGYFGCDDLSDSGHRFLQASLYYYGNRVVKYFMNLGYEPNGVYQIGINDYTSDGGGLTKQGAYGATFSLPTLGFADKIPNEIGIFPINVISHEYGHAVSFLLGYKPNTGQDGVGLSEAIASYFEYAVDNVSYDINPRNCPTLENGLKQDCNNTNPYGYDSSTDISNYSNPRYQYKAGMGQDVRYVIVSTWWNLREKIGENVTDSLVFGALKLRDMIYNKCAVNSALNAMLNADSVLYQGVHNSTIIETFGKHNIFPGKCL